jgi:4-amino-4-deoxy-L-arabinose transferase-like glycosyltransferase
MSEPTSTDHRLFRLTLWGIVLLTVARVVSLVFNRTDLFVDESQYWYWSLHLAPGYYSKPPLIAWVIAATTALFGHAEWAVRLAAPLLHGVTAVLLALIGKRTYGEKAGAFAGLTFISLPAVSFSSLLISTDVPLLTAWAVALLLYVRWIETPTWRLAIGIGVTLAIGLNAKYAMGFFIGAAILHLLAENDLRARLAGGQIWFAFAIGLAGLVPNALWNLANGSPTLSHTERNIGWGKRIDPRHVLEFVGSQFGVFGPIILTLLILAALGRLRTRNHRADRLFLLFSIPILLVFVGEAIMARAYANWAATAYPAGAVLVGAIMAGSADRWWTRTSFALAGVFTAVLLITPAFAPEVVNTKIGSAYTRVIGWSAFARDVKSILSETGARSVVVSRREHITSLLYYLRDDVDHGLVIVMAPFEGKPHHHFEMALPYRTDLPAPVLTLSENPPADMTNARTIDVAPGVARGRKIYVSVGIGK